MKKIIFTLIMAFFAAVALFAAESATLNPVKDGFVKQSDDTYYDAFQNMELSSYVNNNREIFLDFDLTSVAFTPQHATLKVYLNSVSSATPIIVAAYAQTGNVINESLTFTNRPVTGQQRNVDIHMAQDSVGKWLNYDVSYFVKHQDLSSNKLLSFRIVIVYPPTTSSTSPLVTIGSIESANAPELVLSDTAVPGVYEVPFAAINSFTAPTSNVTAGKPEFAFNGVGLLPDMCHETAADNKAWRTASGSLPHHMIVKMNEAININKFHIWNMNWLFGTGLTDLSNRGVKNIDIYVSSSTDDLSGVSDFTDVRWKKVSVDGLNLTQATASASYTGEDVAVSDADNALWFAFKMNSNFTTTSYVGLSEVKIYNEIVASGPTTSITETSKPEISASSRDGVLTINKITPDSRVELFNVQGQLIRNEMVQGISVQWNVPSGVYVVRANGRSIKAVNR